jgi:hypothetical protein
MNEELIGISGFCGQRNLPGVLTLKYLPIAWLDVGEYEEFISPAYNFNKAIVPTLGGEAWLSLPFFPLRGDGWNERHRKTDQGDVYGQEVEGIIAKLRPEVSGEFERMKRHRFLLHLLDSSGKNWLIGRLSEPLEFIAGGETGSRSGGLSSYSFRFAGETSRRAFGYSPVF